MHRTEDPSVKEAISASLMTCLAPGAPIEQGLRPCLDSSYCAFEKAHDLHRLERRGYVGKDWPLQAGRSQPGVGAPAAALRFSGPSTTRPMAMRAARPSLPWSGRPEQKAPQGEGNGDSRPCRFRTRPRTWKNGWASSSQVQLRFGKETERERES